ncbi:multidrug ABC transporter ATP-binding protein [Kitasatospora sp. NE20-6]|uniref:ABC transporter ATP-binding protein n=1 Tax=Kitasatospora sp. NE20-6 TaxID=2859066 RepID=UPI0034DBCC3E
MSRALPVAGRRQVRRAAWAELRADRRAVAAVVVLDTLAAAAGLVGPRLLGLVVDTVRSAPGPSAVAAVDRLALAVAAATAARILLSRHALLLGAGFGERAAARVRERFLERVLALPAATAGHATTGDLVTRGTEDVDTVATTLRDAVPAVFVATVQTVLLVGAVVLLDPLLGLSGLTCLLLFAVVLRWYLRRARAAYLTEADATAELAEVITANAAGARTTEALALRQSRHEAAEHAVDAARRTRLRTLRLRTVLFPTVEVAYVLPVVCVLLAGGVLLDRGAVTLGTVVAAALYVRQLDAPLDTLLQWAEQLQSAGASFARLEGLADIGAAPDATRGTAAGQAAPGAEPGTGGGRIRVSGVHHHHPGRADVLHGVDLEVRPGERLAVVGPSGAGKSTLGRLLAGVDAPTTGTVTVDGTPVAALPAGQRRREVVLVTQEHHVFQDTLRGNLLIGAPEAGDDRLRDALATVGADWAAELPDGLDTRLGGTAYRPDGGQAQQLALARVLLADPRTLVLDEATALLDPATAHRAERALAAALEGRTVVSVAHRLRTARDADRIAVVDGGVITELGTHDDLVAADGTYAALWRTWHGS